MGMNGVGRSCGVCVSWRGAWVSVAFGFRAAGGSWACGGYVCLKLISVVWWTWMTLLKPIVLAW